MRGLISHTQRYRSTYSHRYFGKPPPLMRISRESAGRRAPRTGRSRIDASCTAFRRRHTIPASPHRLPPLPRLYQPLLSLLRP